MDSRYFPQFLLNSGKITAIDAAKLLPLCQKGVPGSYEADHRAFIHLRESPVREVINRLAGEKLAEVAPAYADYMQLFMDSLFKYMKTLAVIDPNPVEGTFNKSLQTVSQGMHGGLDIVPGIMADGRSFLTLAERMSGEVFETLDELAIDSLQEFINVVNGIFSIKMAERGIEVELDAPRQKMIADPRAANLLMLKFYAAFGSFYVVLASDDFIR